MLLDWVLLVWSATVLCFIKNVEYKNRKQIIQTYNGKIMAEQVKRKKSTRDKETK
jgi:hypothetical protein